MAARDVTDILELALEASGSSAARAQYRPRLLSGNGPSYVAFKLADWLASAGMPHTRNAPCHPQTQDKIERWRRTLKNRILLENHCLPWQTPSAGRRLRLALQPSPLAAPAAHRLTSNQGKPDTPILSKVCRLRSSDDGKTAPPGDRGDERLKKLYPARGVPPLSGTAQEQVARGRRATSSLPPPPGRGAAPGGTPSRAWRRCRPVSAGCAGSRCGRPCGR